MGEITDRPQDRPKPRLLRVEPDFHAAGAMLVDKLLAGIAGELHDLRRVPVRLVARASTARG